MKIQKIVGEFSTTTILLFAATSFQIIRHTCKFDTAMWLTADILEDGRSFNVKAYTATIPVFVSTSNFVTRDVELAIFDRIVKFGFINCKNIDWIISKKNSEIINMFY